MKSIILAAGKGERLLPLTKDRPKVCIELGDGTTILSRQIKTLCNHQKIDEIILGTGHGVDKVEELSSEVSGSCKTTFVYNPFYAVSGPLVTLWVVLNKIHDSGFMFMNGDTFFSDAVYAKIENLFSTSREGIFLLCSEVQEVEDDDVKVKLNKDNRIIEAAKNITDYDFISAGLMVVAGEKSSARFRNVLDKVAKREDFLKHNKTWHSFIKDLAEAGVDIEPLKVDKPEWQEVDIHSDLQNLQNSL